MKQTKILCEQKAAPFIVTVTYGLKFKGRREKNPSQKQKDQNII